MVFCNIKDDDLFFNGLSHNPYFNRWFSAIYNQILKGLSYDESQSLF